MYELHAVLGGVAVAGALGFAAYAGTARRASGWATVFHPDGSPFRGGAPIRIPTTEPRAVRLAAGAFVFTAGVTAIRSGLGLLDDLINLVDEPHRRLGLVPSTPTLSLVTLAYGGAGLIVAGVLVHSARAMRRPEGARRLWGGVAAAVLLPAAVTHAWLVATTCESIYWTRRMLVYSVAHALALALALIAAVLASRSAHRTSLETDELGPLSEP